MKFLSKTIFLVVVAFVLVIGASSPVFAATTNVSITSTGFVPESISITVGDTVVWTNNDTTDHTATDDELTWDTDIIAPSDTGSQVFATAGTYTYSDTIDPTLTGTITVETAAVESSTTKGGTTSATPKPVATTQPVSGVSGPTMALMTAGGLLMVFGFLSLRML